MPKRIKPLSDKQLETFRRMLKQGALEQLEEMGDWETVDLVDEHLNKFRDVGSDEFFTTPTFVAEFFWLKDQEHDLLDALLRRIKAQGDAHEAFEQAVEILRVDTEIPNLERYACKANRETLAAALDLREWATAEEIITEIKNRIV